MLIVEHYFCGVFSLSPSYFLDYFSDHFLDYFLHIDSLKANEQNPCALAEKFY